MNTALAAGQNIARGANEISTIAHFLSRAARLEQVRGSISIPTFSRTIPSKLKTVSAVIRGVVGESEVIQKR